MDKLIEELDVDLDKEILDMIAESLKKLRISPALTVREMHPDLTKEELDYVMSKYKGPMKRG